MDRNRVIQVLRARPRLQVALVRMLPLVLMAGMGLMAAPWNPSSANSSQEVAGLTMGVLAFICLVGWSAVCIYERTVSGARDLVSFTLYMLVIAGMRHVAEGGQFMGHAPLFLVGVVWMAIFASIPAFSLAWLMSAVFLLGPPLVMTEHYNATVSTHQGRLFVFAVASILAWAVLFAMRLLRAQLAEASRAKQLHEAILQGAGECYVCVDAYGTIVEFNAIAEDVFGRSSDEVLGKHIELLLEKAPEYPQAPQTGRQAQGLVGKHADGTTFPLECFAGYVQMPDKILHPLFMHDITTRQRRERMRAVQLEVSNLMSAAPPDSEFTRRALALVGTGVDWHGALMMARTGEHYRTVAAWTAEDDPAHMELLMLSRSRADDPYWERLRMSGSTCDEASSELPAPAGIIAGGGGPQGTCLASAVTSDGAWILLAWTGDRSMLANEAARTDYLTHLHVMVTQIAQYLVRAHVESQLRSLQALELNDDVVQALYISFMYRNQGQHDRADEYAQRAFTASKRFITRLAAAAGDVSPGDLVRKGEIKKTENAPFEGDA
jgi:PAS domain S-box-containing protein